MVVFHKSNIAGKKNVSEQGEKLGSSLAIFRGTDDGLTDWFLVDFSQ